MPHPGSSSPTGPTRPVRVVLIESHDTLRALLTDQLSGHHHITVVGSASTVDDGLSLALDLAPDVAVLDHSVTDVADYFSLGAATARNPDISWIVLSGSASQREKEALRRAGAAAHLTKQIRGLDLPGIVMRVAQGETGIGF